MGRTGLPRTFRRARPAGFRPPCVGDAPAAHPAYNDSLIRLRGMGVRFGEPYSGEESREAFRWERALDLLDV